MNRILLSIIVLMSISSAFLQSAPVIPVQIETGLSLNIHTNKYVINYCKPDYTIDNDTILNTIFSTLNFYLDEYDNFDEEG
jgi:hypothetical protein